MVAMVTAPWSVELLSTLNLTPNTSELHHARIMVSMVTMSTPNTIIHLVTYIIQCILHYEYNLIRDTAKIAGYQKGQTL